jgi:hypothetical protein
VCRVGVHVYEQILQLYLDERLSKKQAKCALKNLSSVLCLLKLRHFCDLKPILLISLSYSKKGKATQIKHIWKHKCSKYIFMSLRVMMWRCISYYRLPKQNP